MLAHQEQHTAAVLPHPTDEKYAMLNADLQLLDKASSEFDVIQQYVKVGVATREARVPSWPTMHCLVCVRVELGRAESVEWTWPKAWNAAAGFRLKQCGEMRRTIEMKHPSIPKAFWRLVCPPPPNRPMQEVDRP